MPSTLHLRSEPLGHRSYSRTPTCESTFSPILARRRCQLRWSEPIGWPTPRQKCPGWLCRHHLPPSCRPQPLHQICASWAPQRRPHADTSAQASRLQVHACQDSSAGLGSAACCSCSLTLICGMVLGSAECNALWPELAVTDAWAGTKPHASLLLQQQPCLAGRRHAGILAQLMLSAANRRPECSDGASLIACPSLSCLAARHQCCHLPKIGTDCQQLCQHLSFIPRRHNLSMDDMQ